MPAFFSFIKSVFSEPDGTGSCARVLSVVLTTASIGWITHIVLHTHTIPPLDGVATLIAAPYGINKLLTKAGEVFKKDDGKQ